MFFPLLASNDLWERPNFVCTLKIILGTYSQLMVPGFVHSLADGTLLGFMVLLYSCFDLSWPSMTPEDAQTLCAVLKYFQESTVSWWCQDFYVVRLMVADGAWWCLFMSACFFCVKGDFENVWWAFFWLLRVIFKKADELCFYQPFFDW